MLLFFSFSSTAHIQKFRGWKEIETYSGLSNYQTSSHQTIKITVFIVKMHLAHATTYEDLVRFVGNELEEPVLKKYLRSIENCKNASYLLTTALNTFLNLISNWMKDNTMKIVREHEDFTIVLNEATDESNR